MTDTNAELKANDFARQADKTLKKFSFFSSGSKYEDAAELYEKAANQFKIAKKWHESGEMFAKVAELHIKMKEGSRAGQFYQLAADNTKKGNPIEAIEYYRTAVSIYCDSGKFSNAAKLQKEIAEIFESEGQLEEALESYNQAADNYLQENQTSSANNMLQKVAQYSAELKRYDTAIELYEKVGRACMDNNLLKFNAKSHLLNAGICVLLVGDTVNTQQKLAEYAEIDYTFADSREGKLLTDLAKALEEGDIDAFTEVVYEYDNISKLDSWKTTMLLRIKEAIHEPVSLM